MTTRLLIAFLGLASCLAAPAVFAQTQVDRTTLPIASPEALPAGPATVVVDFVYDGGGPGKGGKATLSVNGKPVAEGRIEKTQPNIFSADETADVGIDNQTPVAEGIGIGTDTRFTGRIDKVTLEVGPVR